MKRFEMELNQDTNTQEEDNQPPKQIAIKKLLGALALSIKKVGEEHSQGPARFF